MGDKKEGSKKTSVMKILLITILSLVMIPVLFLIGFYASQRVQYSIIENDVQKSKRVQELKEEYDTARQDREDEQYAMDNAKEPKIGMTALQVMNTEWGYPKKKNTTTNAYGTTEQWVYKDNRYVYLENGIVRTIQD